jgi:hypothetical protein
MFPYDLDLASGSFTRGFPERKLHQSLLHGPVHSNSFSCLLSQLYKCSVHHEITLYVLFSVKKRRGKSITVTGREGP